MTVTERQVAPIAQMPAADSDVVAGLVRNASTSFYWAMRLLPREKREAIFAVYAFCRDVDDIADDDDVPMSRKRSGLDAWRRDIAALFTGGTPSHPLAGALAGPVHTFGLRREDFEAVIDGMEMDAGTPLMAPDAATLDLYCDRVACAVGRLCVHIFGEPNERGYEVAAALGRALQLTNVLRDVHEDAERDRLYLPREIIVRHGIDPVSVNTVLAHPAYPAVWRDLAAQAKAAFDWSQRALAACDRSKIRPARIMMEVYRLGLKRMQALDDQALADPTVNKRRVGKVAKLLIAIRHGLF